MTEPHPTAKSTMRDPANREVSGDPSRILAASAEALAAFAFAEPRSATRAALLMPRSRLLPSAARLARPVTSPVHSYPRSLRNFAQYSSRFRISRSKPRSGGL